MKKKLLDNAYFIAAVLFYAVGAAYGFRGVGVTYLCLGSCFLCLGGAMLNRKKDGDDSEQ